MSERKRYHTKREYITVALSYQPSEQMQVLNTLAKKDNRSVLINQARANAQELSQRASGQIPTDNFIRAYGVKREMFLNPLTQPQDTSQHNLLHATATEVLSAHIAMVLNADPAFLEAHPPIDVIAEAIAGSVHDTKRFLNSLESAVNINAHGRRASNQMEQLVRQMGQNVDMATQKTAAEIVTYHDAPDVPKEHNNVELQVFKLADSLGMVRFILHPSNNTIINNLSLQTVEDKLLQYQFDNPFVAALTKKYLPIALALYALSDEYLAQLRENIKQNDPKGLWSKRYQVDSVIQAAKDLGLLAK